MCLYRNYGAKILNFVSSTKSKCVVVVPSCIYRVLSARRVMDITYKKRAAPTEAQLLAI